MLAVVAAAVAAWLTLRAGFLQYPDWLAAQKVDFIIGPIGVGLYWRYSRPYSRFGLMLIVLGLLGVIYILESSTTPWLFRIGVLSEDAIYLWTTIVILAFPSGRLDGLPERLVIALNAVTAALVLVLFFPPSAPGFTISGCRVDCPGSAGGTSYTASWLIRHHVLASLPVAVALATAGVIAWRFATGTPPRRRALAIGAPVALLFVFSEASYRGLFIFAPGGLGAGGRPVQDALQWALAGTRSFVWYGFLAALIAAQLQAGRVLRRLVRQSLTHPSLPELEPLLREPLGDPSLRLGFWRAEIGGWASADGAPLESPREGQALTEIARDGRPAAAIVHDRQLADDPELLQAAGAVALLSLENAELESAWKDSLHELSDSRARIVQAGDRERRKLELDLHDGAQQRLLAIQMNVARLRERTGDPDLATELDRIGEQATSAVDELRNLAHGIYPAELREGGVGAGLRAYVGAAPVPIEVVEDGFGRCDPAVEACVYFCSLEAVQNAVKHGGRGVRVTITLERNDDAVSFAVDDDGAGFDPDAMREGFGLVSIGDRLAAVGGEFHIFSAPGEGASVRGMVPVGVGTP
ncbi:MAG TPA: histidine kinase [Gaiellaceae bacterium]|nr:histidine kinase [Gaiellaceae bacterium]